MSLNDSVSRKIIEIRQKHNLSQEEFASMCDISSRYLGKIERCQVNPSLNTLEKISKGMGIRVSELVDSETNTEGAREI